MAKTKRQPVVLDVPTGTKLVRDLAIAHIEETLDYLCTCHMRARPATDGSWLVETLNGWGYDGAWGRWTKVLVAAKWGDDNEAVARGFIYWLEVLGHTVIPAEPCKPCGGTGKVARRKWEKGRWRECQGRCRRCLGTGWMSPAEEFDEHGAFRPVEVVAPVVAAVTPSTPTRRITQDQLSALRNVKDILGSIAMARRLLAEAKTPEEAARCRMYIEGRERDLERERKLAGGEGA